MSRKLFRERMMAAERKLTISYLTRADGSVNRAAQISGLHRSVIRRMVLRHHLEAYLQRAKRPPVFKGNAAWHSLADV